VLALMDKVRCVSDATKSNPGFFPGWVKVALKSGAMYERQQLRELGTTENPIKIDDVITKFRNNLGASYSEKQIDKIKDLILDFDQLENSSSLMDSLCVMKN